MAVRVVNPPGKFDAQGAQIASDASTPINLVGAAGQFIYIDTAGYSALVLQSSGLTGSFATSNDQISWAACFGYQIAGAAVAASSSFSAATFLVPVTARYIRLQVSVAGSAVAYLRNFAVPNPSVLIPQNLTQINGSTPASSGLSGALAVAGPTANAIAPTANPNLIAGIDSGTPGTLLGVPLTRRVLTDNTGRLRLAQETPVASFQNAPALNVQDTGQVDGQSRDELLTQILLELRINNQLMSDLPLRLYTAFQSLQLAPNAQQNFAGFVSDEPAAFRSDPTIFNQ
jgi:hypothetical protein